MSVHLSIMRQLLIESGEINARILSGDICSAKTGLPRARKLCDQYAKILRAEDCVSVKIEPFIAAGGLIGVSYDFVASGDPVTGSVTIRSFG